MWSILWWDHHQHQRFVSTIFGSSTLIMFLCFRSIVSQIITHVALFQPIGWNQIQVKFEDMQLKEMKLILKRVGSSKAWSDHLSTNVSITMLYIIRKILPCVMTFLTYIENNFFSTTWKFKFNPLTLTIFKETFLMREFSIHIQR